VQAGCASRSCTPLRKRRASCKAPAQPARGEGRTIGCVSTFKPIRNVVAWKQAHARSAPRAGAPRREGTFPRSSSGQRNDSGAFPKPSSGQRNDSGAFPKSSSGQRNDSGAFPRSSSGQRNDSGAFRPPFSGQRKDQGAFPRSSSGQRNDPGAFRSPFSAQIDAPRPFPPPFFLFHDALRYFPRRQNAAPPDFGLPLSRALAVAFCLAAPSYNPEPPEHPWPA
jgi:hypothetical protein